ncbi:HAD family hydrolase [Lacticaseibacillus porcinae]|uniref:HAD family hydrolase n=1 Tax=Lacticaseibacillus porcinae TaxID=1123687 RepID=UPI0013DD990C|nr:HAD family hydrolase [Lacticaseibacillus porcinae]
MTPYAIFMDIDGTLVDHSQIPTQATVDAIAKFRKAGNLFFIASGRPLFSARVMADRIGPNLNVICSNGSVTAVDQQVDNIHLTSAALRGIYDIAMKYEIRTHFFTKESVIFLDQASEPISRDAKNRIAGEDPSKNRRVHSVEELVALAPEITNGISISADEPRRLQAKAEMAKLADIDVSSSGFDNIEITAKGINKAWAIKHVCEKLGIPMTHTMAFGDGDNDLQMLTTVHYGVAMGNANERVKAAVHHFTTDIHHDGVAHYLHHFFD